jgi:hypothetical protein
MDDGKWRTAGWFSGAVERFSRTAGRFIHTAGWLNRTAGRFIRAVERLSRTVGEMNRMDGTPSRTGERFQRVAGGFRRAVEWVSHANKPSRCTFQKQTRAVLRTACVG